jgi:hypothetical protein
MRVTPVVRLNAFVRISYMEASVSYRELAPTLLDRTYMTLRVDTASEASATVVSVAGRLEGEGLREFLKTCDSIEGEFVLDLSGLRSAGSEGMAAIRGLVDSGQKLRGVSPFIRFLLDGRPSAEAD